MLPHLLNPQRCGSAEEGVKLGRWPPQLPWADSAAQETCKEAGWGQGCYSCGPEVQLLPRKSQPQKRLHLHPEMEPTLWLKLANLDTAGRGCRRKRRHVGAGITALEQCPRFSPGPLEPLYYITLSSRWLSAFGPLQGFSSASSKSSGKDSIL